MQPGASLREEKGAQDRERVLAAVVIGARGDLQQLEELVTHAAAVVAPGGVLVLSAHALELTPEDLGEIDRAFGSIVVQGARLPEAVLAMSDR